MSCFKWLEHVEKDIDSEEDKENKLSEEEELKLEKERDEELRKYPFFKNLPRESE